MNSSIIPRFGRNILIAALSGTMFIAVSAAAEDKYTSTKNYSVNEFIELIINEETDKTSNIFENEKSRHNIFILFIGYNKVPDVMKNAANILAGINAPRLYAAVGKDYVKFDDIGSETATMAGFSDEPPVQNIILIQKSDEIVEKGYFPEGENIDIIDLSNKCRINRIFVGSNYFHSMINEYGDDKTEDTCILSGILSHLGLYNAYRLSDIIMKEGDLGVENIRKYFQAIYGKQIHIDNKRSTQGIYAGMKKEDVLKLIDRIENKRSL